MKPIIGIPTHLMFIGSSPSGGKEVAYCNEDFSLAVSKAGGIPILLPYVENQEDLLIQLVLCDGILLPGGDDINPLLYGEEPYQDLGEVSARIDQYELNLARFALSADKPILGICRGCQLLNIALGGNIYQDFSQYPTTTLKHHQKARRSEVTHTIQINSDSILHTLFGESLKVNSFHHQAIHQLGKNVVATAHAKDGVVEGIQLSTKPFVLGVQWHPEVMLNESEDMFLLFKTFISACK